MAAGVAFELLSTDASATAGVAPTIDLFAGDSLVIGAAVPLHVGDRTGAGVQVSARVDASLAP